MACLEDDRMRLEQEYLRMFSTVAAWRITGRTLELLDGGGKVVATFTSGG
jgi:heat shock protein HslJ